MTRTNTELYDDLTNLRVYSPEVWAIVRGASNIGAICKSLMVTPKAARRALEESPDVRAKDDKGFEWVLNEGSPRYSELAELSAFSKRLFASIVVWENKNKGADTRLTVKQTALLESLYGLEQPFTTLQAAEAQGYLKAGYMKVYLTALEKKGWLEQIPGRPLKWRTLQEKSE